MRNHWRHRFGSLFIRIDVVCPWTTLAIDLDGLLNLVHVENNILRPYYRCIKSPDDKGDSSSLSEKGLDERETWKSDVNTVKFHPSKRLTFLLLCVEGLRHSWKVQTPTCSKGSFGYGVLIILRRVFFTNVTSRSVWRLVCPILLCPGKGKGQR